MSISTQLGVLAPLNIGSYLGQPSLRGRNKRPAFAYLRERMWNNRLQGWQTKLLSQACKKVLIKTVAHVIFTFYISSFLLPFPLYLELEFKMNSSWWNMKHNGSRHINCFKWNTLCLMKERSGMGSRIPHSFNLPMLAKHGWNVINNSHILASRMIKAKYFHHGDFLSAQLDANPSFIW